MYILPTFVVPLGTELSINRNKLLKLIFVVLEYLLSCILFLQLNFSRSPIIIHEEKRKENTLKIVVQYGLKIAVQKNDAFIKIRTEID